MSDQLVRAISRDGLVKAAAVSTRGLTERARQIHRTTPVATAALGRARAACSMMGNALKDSGASVTLQIKGGGPLGTVLAVSDNQGNVRGTVDNPAVDLPLRADGKLDVGAAVGCDGTLTIIQDLNMNEPYTGSVGLLSGEIAEDIAAYYVESEQIPTACGLGVLVDTDQSVLCAGGYLLQLLPGAPDGVIDALEEAVRRLGPVTEVLHQGADAAQVLERLLEGMEPQLLERSPVSYKCYCSRDRVSQAVISLGKAELRDMIDKEGHADLTCQFCDKVYHFSKEELEDLLASATKD